MPAATHSPSSLDAGGRAVATFSRALARTPGLASMLNASHVIVRPSAAHASQLGCVVGWGNKPNTAAGRAYAARHGLPYLALEDGFLRSVGLGKQGAPPLSVVVDDLGIYYDADQPSRLERWLAGEEGADDPLQDGALLARAERCMEAIREAGLSKYNHAPVDEVRVPGHGPRVLVVDQTRGDLSVSGAGLGPADFTRMLRVAREEHPRAELWVKSHPDVLAGRARGHFDAGALRSTGARLWTTPVAPLAFLTQFDHVYVGSSQLGLEALFLGKPVTCFGTPFYAGWGLTDDRRPAPDRRGRARSLKELFAAAYLLYARYRDPLGDQRCELEAVVEHLALQRRTFAQNRGRIYCFGFQTWKRPYIRRYLRGPGNDVRFVRSARQAARLGVDAQSRVLVWGQRQRAEAERLARSHGLELATMEDGFLRSVGLGSDLIAPASLVIDGAGAHYDPSRPSELESLLEGAPLDEALLERAARLRRRIVRGGFTKYNQANAAPLALPAEAQGRPIVLVPGQVDDDASVALGAVDIRDNLSLLRAAREARPDAFLVYKPHPDVVSGNRPGRLSAQVARKHCNLVYEGDIRACLDVADEVHTLTSLVGFEALLRGLEVTTYGLPFYAGWGLTRDRHRLARRTRALTVDGLVAISLILYPRYLDPERGCFVTVEQALDRLERLRARRPLRPQTRWLAPLHKLRHAWEGMRHAG